MESDLRECKNKRCPRKGVLVVGGRFCNACGKPMIAGYKDSKPNGKGHQPGEFDTPPITYRPKQAGFFDSSRGLLPMMRSRELPEFISKPAAKEDETWTTDCDIKGCPIAPKVPPVCVPLDIYQKWVWLANRSDTEWIAYLKGTQAADGQWTITSFYIPKQKANGAHCDAADGEIQEGTIGSVHSHVGMNAFFSAEDEKHFNHAVEMVVNRAGDMVANVRVTLNCGKPARQDTKVVLVQIEEAMQLVEELKQKLTEEKPHEQTHWTAYGEGGRYYES